MTYAIIFKYYPIDLKISYVESQPFVYSCKEVKTFIQQERHKLNTSK